MSWTYFSNFMKSVEFRVYLPYLNWWKLIFLLSFLYIKILSEQYRSSQNHTDPPRTIQILPEPYRSSQNHTDPSIQNLTDPSRCIQNHTDPSRSIQNLVNRKTSIMKVNLLFCERVCVERLNFRYVFVFGNNFFDKRYVLFKLLIFYSIGIALIAYFIS